VLKLQTILCPVDLSEASAAVAWLASSLARDHGARLVLLYVAEPPPFVNPGDFQKALRRPDGYQAQLEALLRGIEPAESSTPIAYRLADGDPATEILEAAREMCCDLVVMGTHGRGGLERAWLGSVAEAVLRKAPCPVLTFRISRQASKR
jgi:universal stress protein A